MSVLVVSDTSPIRALHHLGQLSLLSRLFGRIVVPPAVAQELSRARSALPAIDLAQVPFISVQVPARDAQVASLRGTLDVGEAEAIALALELDADALLIDEAAGRAVALSLGVTPIGVLGILRQAKVSGVIPAARPLVDRLRSEIRFFVSDALYDAFLKSVGESRAE